MKILQIIYESYGSPFGFGGAGIRAYEIYNRLKARHEITLLCMKYPGARDGEIEGLKHIFVGTESNSLGASVFAYTFGAAHFLRKHGDSFDVIVENFLPPTPFFARFIAKKPVLLQIQDFWGKHTFSRFPLLLAFPMYLAEKYYPRLYRKFIFVSEVTKAQFRLSGSSIVIPNGIDSNLLELNVEPENYILFISSIDLYKKGLDVLFDAFESVALQYSDISLFIAGTGRDIYIVKDRAEKTSVSGRIRFLGWVSGQAKAQYISKSLFTVLPSRHESQPISILEAAACGKPVIVSDIEELKFVGDAGFGLKFRSGSADDLSKKINTLLCDSLLMKELGAAGRKYASGFTWDNIAIQFESYIKEAVVNSVIRQ